MKRVVVTGMGLVSPIGNTLESVSHALRMGRSGVQKMPQWAEIDGLLTRVAAPVSPIDANEISRIHRRTMGPQAMYAALAAKRAIADAALPEDILRSGRTGLAIGSTLGSPESTHDFFAQLSKQSSVHGIKGTSFPQWMAHTCAANVALVFGITGRVLATSSACTSGSQAIGAGVESIQLGKQEVMIAGGADEAHFTTAVTFDLIHATSTSFNAAPERTPRPFDVDRDGLVIGEGSGIVVLESIEHALARGAPIHAEVIGYATTCDGSHISQPVQVGLERCVRLGLEDAQISTGDVDYINAHATGTRLGDGVEAAAMRELFGDRVPISSTKGLTGHTLGACGALETIFTILMMKGGFAAGTHNLENIEESCQGIRHVQHAEAHIIRTALNNNFAFGGVNTTLVLRSFEG